MTASSGQLALQKHLALASCPFSLSNSLMHLLKWEAVAYVPAAAAQQNTTQSDALWHAIGRKRHDKKQACILESLHNW